MHPETIAMTLTLQIIHFHNCEGCRRRIRNALRQIGGVELVEFDPENGSVTVSTAKHPEVIRDALERKSKKKVVILSRDISHTYQNPNSIVPHQGTMIPAQGTINVQDLAEALLRMSHVEGLDGVEFTQSNTFRLSFNRRENRPVSHGDILSSGDVHIEDGELEYAPPRRPPRPPPWPATEPSAPLIPTAEEEVYGYPPEFYGFSTASSHHHPSGCCTII